MSLKPSLPLALALVLFAAPAAADKAACVAALDRAQSFESAQKLLESRASYLACASESCPQVVREDCGRLLANVEAALPSVVLAAEVEGRDADDAKAFLDGAEVALDGRPVVVDPGPHVARFERAASGAVEVRVVARAGEKNRLVTGSFVIVREPPPPKTLVEGRKTPVIPLLLGGTSLLALGGAAMFRLHADADAERMRGSCAPACDAAERDALSDKLVVSNVSLGIGIGALALAAVVFLVDGRK